MLTRLIIFAITVVFTITASFAGDFKMLPEFANSREMLIQASMDLYGNAPEEKFSTESGEVLVLSPDGGSGVGIRNIHIYNFSKKNGGWQLLATRIAVTSSLSVQIEKGILVCRAQGGERLLEIPVSSLRVNFDPVSE